MKTLLSILALVFCLSANAQTLSNPGFENWSQQTYYDSVPDQWWGLYCMTVFRTNDAFLGSYASRTTGMLACGIAPGVLISGPQPASGNIIDGGSPFTIKPNIIQGFYKLTDAQPGDSAEVTVILKKYNTITMQRDTVSIGVLALPPAASYTLFSVSMNDLMPSVMPDSIILIFNSSKHLLIDWNTGTLPSLFVDAIKLDEAAGLHDQTALAASSLYPNPFVSIATLSVDTQEENLVLYLFDALGNEVMSAAESGRGIFELHRSGLPSGNYFYQVRSRGKLIATGQLVAE
ncbi:MAG: T9SS type A sorting domain-containing protein [Bacteroidota bacterium]